VSPDSGTSVYRYDLDGNSTQRVDGGGAVTNYTYDALDRVITAAYPTGAAENVTYTYDQGSFGIGRLGAIADAVGTLTRSHDERGNVLNETRANGAVTLVTTYTYDAASRVASLTYPSGWTVAYTRDAMGHTTAVTAQPPDGSASVPVVASAGYQPFGPINALKFGNGVAETRTFDLDYRLTGLADAGMGALQNLTYGYDAANNVSSISDGVTAGNSQRFGYDALDRVTSATGGYGGFGYTYDAAGNRLSESVGGSPTAYAYTAHSNQLAGLTASGVTQTIGYDKTGKVNSFNPASDAITGAVYNQAGQLAAVMAGANATAQYTYDAAGQRLFKVGAVSGTTLYQYDRSGHLLEETDGQGNAQVDYIYLDNLPVATLSPTTGQVYFLHNDRLGTPQLATDSGQNVVWTANYGPFGEMNAIPSLIVQNLRLPGQEFDVDTGLYHNGFRDYVPGWGRYLQSDPIGLAGGMNTYGYVQANPAKFADERGLGGRASLFRKALVFALKKVGKGDLAHTIEDASDVTLYQAEFAVGGVTAVGGATVATFGWVWTCPPCVEAIFLGGGSAAVAGDVVTTNAWDAAVALWNAPIDPEDCVVVCAPPPIPTAGELSQIQQLLHPTGSTCTQSQPQGTAAPVVIDPSQGIVTSGH
jgi:RHS repeat-associated protein